MRVSRGMIHTDRITFTVILCLIHLKGMKSSSYYQLIETLFQHLLRSKEAVAAVSDKTPTSSTARLSPDQLDNMIKLETKYVKNTRICKIIARSY